MLDVQLFGLVPRWHDFTSLLFHVINSNLLFLLLKRLKSLGMALSRGCRAFCTASTSC